MSTTSQPPVHFNLARSSYENELVTRAAAFSSLILDGVSWAMNSADADEQRWANFSFADGLRRRGVDGMFAAVTK